MANLCKKWVLFLWQHCHCSKACYPGGYHPSVPGQRINVPLPRGTGGEDFRHEILENWMPALHTFKPQMIFISAGFDAHAEDPLEELALGDNPYKH